MNDTVRTILVVVLVLGVGGWAALKVGQKAWPKFKPLYFAHKEIKSTLPEVNVSLHTSEKEITVTATAAFNVAKEPERCHTVAEKIHGLVLKHIPDARRKPTVIHILDMDSILRRDANGTRVFRYPTPDLVRSPPKSSRTLSN